jgi:hypothetical protein|tara:strand:- start:437 stop:793 length:357 start_codon:yes stop_codon:yes gene_type:complete
MNKAMNTKERWRRAWRMARATQAAYNKRDFTQSINHLLITIDQNSTLSAHDKAVEAVWSAMADDMLQAKKAIEHKELWIRRSAWKLKRVIESAEEGSIFLPAVALNDAARKCYDWRHQ